MIDELDEAVRQLLIRELPIRNNEIDIAFNQPKREWSARLSRPTLNLYLYDLQENTRLRQQMPQWHVERHSDGTSTQRRNPVRFDLHYMVTAWATEPDDEHRLLTRTLMAFMRQPYLPEDLLTDALQYQRVAIPIEIAQPNELVKAPDLWGVLDNEMRPALGCTFTLSLDPHQPIVTPLVRSREFRMGQSAAPSVRQELMDPENPDSFWTVGGTIHTDLSVEKVRVTLIERGMSVPLQSDGRFAIGGLRAGQYTLELTVENRPPTRHTITVPSSEFDLQL